MMQDLIPLFARVLLSGIFIKAGVDKIFAWEATQQTIATKLPLPLPVLIVTVVVLIAGGLSILLGFKTRWGAIALIGFLIPTTVLFHTDFAERMQQIQFFKNLAIMGGLALLTTTDPGTVSLDAVLKKTGRMSG